MKKIINCILFIIFFSSTIIAQTKQEVIAKMNEEVSYLASDELEGRATGSASEKVAADYIRSKFNEYGILPKGEDGYFQYFKATIKKNPHSEAIEKQITGTNVIGYVDNKKNQTIIIGAHYDHVGFGSFGSLYDGEKAVHNGADDNASGVSILLNLARGLKKNSYSSYYNYLFIAFSVFM